MEGSVREVPPVVVLRPQSGYANRLQAIASAWLLAKALGSRLIVDWRPDPAVAPVQLEDVLDPRVCEQLQDSTVEDHKVPSVSLGVLPPYLNFDSQSGVVTLAGLEFGEQHFMPKLSRLLKGHDVRGIVISAGGKFALEGGAVLSVDEERIFRQNRELAYAQLPLHPEVELRARIATKGLTRFHALHLRYSDRALESPWKRHITAALTELKNTTEATSLFIASDSASAKEEWLRKSREIGWNPWTADSDEFPREDPRSSWKALVDWRILSSARSLVFFGASSFAEEAAVAGGSYERSTPLRASRVRRAWMQAQKQGSTLRTYPRRRGWL